MHANRAMIMGLLPLVIGGCQRHLEPGMTSAATSQLSACTVNGATVGKTEPITLKAVVNVNLSAILDLQNLPRNVRKNPSNLDPIIHDIPRDDISGTLISKPTAGDPLDVWIRALNIAPPGYIAIKIIKPTGSNYSFYNDVSPGGIGGVGAGSDEGFRILCSGRTTLPDPQPPRSRQFVVFYVDLAKMPPASPTPSPSAYPKFNIGVIPDAPPKTLIFIDPKVRNDG